MQSINFIFNYKKQASVLGRFYKRVLLGVFFVCLLLPVIVAADARVSAPVPHFRVQNASGGILHKGTLKGKVGILIYQSKDHLEVNRPVRRALIAHYHAQSPTDRQKLRAIPVVDCEGANIVTKPLYKSGIRDESADIGITVYCDWSGAMKRSFGMHPHSNLIIVDKSGVVRMLKRGAIPFGEVTAIKALITQLVQE